MLKQHEVFVNQVTNRYLALQKSDLFCRALLLLFLEVLGIRRLRTTSVQESLSCGLEQTSNKFAAETGARTDLVPTHSWLSVIGSRTGSEGKFMMIARKRRKALPCKGLV